MMIINPSHNLIISILLFLLFTKLPPYIIATSIDYNALHHSIDPHWDTRAFLAKNCSQQSIEVKFPLIQINEDEEYTSLITCYNGHPAMDINSLKYYIRSVDYDRKTLVIAPVIVVDDHLKYFSPCATDLTPFYSNDIAPFGYTADVVKVGINMCPQDDSTIVVSLFCFTVKNSTRSCCYRSVLVDADTSSYESECRVLGYFYAAKRLEEMVNSDDDNTSNSKYLELLLQSGFEVTWAPSQNGLAYFLSHPPKVLTPIGVVVSFTACLIICICHWRKRITKFTSNFCLKTKSMRKDDKRIKSFMIKYGSLFPKRYSYSDVQNMTCSFTDKLGQGGYGIVYKGKLDDGSQVAVKVLNRSKAGNKEFLNEVICIGCTYHLNIVTLLGFCIEGSHRALIYEYMPNGSLEKFIHSQKNSKLTLDCEKLMEIALGIARGLEYLHHGCNIGILHFDIKPHNILLDHNLNPKIADFGLAKLSRFPEKIIKMLGARGTAGYIAPEVYSRNYGGVSSKSDVYSYGMMILEMVAGRKNLEVGVEHTSEIYFPYWIYKNLENDCGSLRLYGVVNVNKDSEGMARRMILVGLYCIQTNPMDRPSMKKVLEMLEGRVEELRMPPIPVLDCAQRSPQLLSSIYNYHSSEMVGCVITY